MKTLVTGTAGFIGSFTAARLSEKGDAVVGIDNINSVHPEVSKGEQDFLRAMSMFDVRR